MTTSATSLDTTQVYEDLKRLILHLVHKFQRRYGGDFDELLSEANWHFLRACKNYDPKRGAKIITVVYWYVWNGLRNTLRKQSPLRSAPRSIQREDVPLDDLPSRSSRPLLDRLLKNLSEDAKAIVKLAFAVEGRTAGVRRRRLIDLLRNLGCPTETVLASFTEIRDVLAG